jgi:hypothetical protein
MNFGGERRYVRVSNYSVDGEFVPWFFAPMNWLDKKVRPSYWYDKNRIKLDLEAVEGTP